MKEKTKKDLKDAFYDTIVVAVAFVFVMSMNNKCSGVMQKENNAKIAQKTQNEKIQIINMQKVR